MKVCDFKVILEPDEGAAGYVVSRPALPGCYSQDDAIDEALESIREAILLCGIDRILCHVGVKC